MRPNVHQAHLPKIEEHFNIRQTMCKKSRSNCSLGKRYPYLQLNKDKTSLSWLILISLLSVLFFSQASEAVESGLSLTNEEITWLKSHPELRLSINNHPHPISFWDDEDFDEQKTKQPPPHASNPSFPPGPYPYPPAGNSPNNFQRPMPPHMKPGPTFTVSGENDKFKGVAADYLNEISRLLGIQLNVVQVVNHNHFAALEAMHQKKVDLFVPAIKDERPNRAFMLSIPFVQVPTVVVTRDNVDHMDDIRELESMRIAGVMSIQRKINKLRLDITVQHMSPENGLMAVATGKIDAFIVELSLMSQELSRKPITGIKVAGELPIPSEYVVAVGPHIAPFIPILNKAIKAFPEKKKDEIWRKWFRVNYEKKLTSTSLFNAVAVCIVVTLILVLLWGVRASRRFNKVRTAVEALDPHLLSVIIDDNITITEVTEALCRATGFGYEDLVGQPLMALGSPIEDSPTAINNIWTILQQGDTWKGEVKIMRKDGSTLWAESIISPLRRKNERTTGYSVIYQDVSDRKHFESLSTRDELTGLYNRRHFNDMAPALLKAARKDKKSFAFLLIDIDNFKKYNDTYGHPAGDKVLADVARELSRLFMRNNDITYRMGGEEFGAILVFSDPVGAEVMGNKILTGIRDMEIEHQENEAKIITVSIGIKTVNASDQDDIKTIYEKADKALYKAKQSGRNCLVMAD